jgi:hypothetical protein
LYAITNKVNHRNILLFLLFIASCISCNNNSGKKPVKQAAEYKFEVPKGWATEKIPFPIVFAPQIPYKGFEVLRFTPGWEFTTSEEHWSYSFLWWLDGDIKLDTAVLKEHLSNYYFGLLSQNTRQRHIPANKVIHPTTTITRAKTENGDAETYTGTITMLDYLDLSFPVLTLKCVIHKKVCKTHTGILFEISPQPFGHKVWQQLNHLETSFQCED